MTILKRLITFISLVNFVSAISYEEYLYPTPCSVSDGTLSSGDPSECALIFIAYA